MITDYICTNCNASFEAEERSNSDLCFSCILIFKEELKLDRILNRDLNKE